MEISSQIIINVLIKFREISDRYDNLYFWHPNDFLDKIYCNNPLLDQFKYELNQCFQFLYHLYSKLIAAHLLLFFA